jgi:hypothetical protein
MPDGTSPRLDRVSKPNPQTPRQRDQRHGKEALYSTAPGAAPAFPLVVSCNRCDVSRGLKVGELLGFLRPPVLVNPVSRKVWTRCPTCHRRAWLRVHMGQSLKILLDRRTPES